MVKQDSSSNDASQLLNADGEAVLAALPSATLDIPALYEFRNRSAGFLLSDPALSFRISTQLSRRRRALEKELGPEAAALVLRIRAEACLFTGRITQAKKAYEGACRAAEDVEDPGLLGQILVGRIHLLSLLGEGVQSDRLAGLAEKLLKRAGDKAYLAKLHMNRGNAFYQRDRFAQALSSYEKAAGIFEKLGLKDGTWLALTMNRAIACTNLSRLREARKLFLDCEEGAEAMEQEALLAQARFNRAFLEALRGDYRTAFALLENAEAVFERIGQRDLLASSRRSRSEIYLELGMPEAALELSLKAVEDFESEDMDLDATLSRLDAARAMFESERYESARELLHESRSWLQAKKILPRLAQLDLLEARLELGLGHFSAVSGPGRRALRVFLKHGMHGSEAQAREVLAAALLAEGRPPRAEEVLEAALADHALTLGHRAALWNLAGRISLARRRRPEALRRLSKAREFLEAERALIPGADFRSHAFARQARIFSDLVSATLEGRGPRFSRIFELVESARGRGFRERAAQDWRARPDLPEERALLGSLTRRVEDGEFSGLALANPGELEKLRRRSRKQERKILARIRMREGLAPGGRSWSDESGAQAVADVLLPGETLVEYFLLDDGILALTLDRKRRKLLKMPASAALVRARIEELHLQMESFAAQGASTGNAFLRLAAEESLKQLWRLILEPLESSLPAEGRITLVPQGFLHELPFECLHDGESYLADRYSFLRAPRAGFLTRRRKRPRGGGPALIAGMSRGGPALAAAETRAVARILGSGREVRRLLNPGSTRLLDEMEAARLIHLSTHGHFRRDNPLFSRLSTVDGGIFLSDLLDRKLRAELAVLSTCESGQVPGIGGEDLAGVAHGFLAAGASRLVASRWKVDDQATLDLMKRFWRHWAEDPAGDAVLALAAAAKDLRGTYPHPFHWGAFSVFGF